MTLAVTIGKFNPSPLRFLPNRRSKEVPNIIAYAPSSNRHHKYSLLGAGKLVAVRTPQGRLTDKPDEICDIRRKGHSLVGSGGVRA